MNSKIKILLVGLAAVCAIALMIAFQLNGVNKSLRSQFALKEQEFQSEKQGLSQQLSSTLEAKKRLDAEMGDLRVKFDSVAKEKDSLKDKFDLVTKERASLVEKVQDLAKQKKKLEDEVVQLKKTGGSEFSPSSIIPTSTPTDDAYWATVLRDKASLEIQVKNLTTQLTDLQLKTEKAMEEGRKLDLQLKTVIGARIDLERRIVYNEKLAETLSEDLVREKRDKKAVVDQLDGLRQENYELKSRLMALGDKKISLETKVVDLQSEREVLAKRLAELDQILQERVDQIIQVKNDLKSARNEAKNISAKDSRVVQLQPIVVKASEEGPAGNRKAPTAGQVLAINEENNFVIIDLGEQDGSRVGQVFSIYRNTQKIASIEIIQTRKEISAADIKNVSSGAKIKIGDTVS
jgi:chromosome segregation ATPase